MMGIGVALVEILIPFFKLFLPIIPGDVFPYFFGAELNGYPVLSLQRALIVSIVVAIVAGFLGTFLLVQNLALIGDGLAHVAFGGIAIGIVLQASSPLWYALVFSIFAALAIYELQSRGILTGDASIAIFMTGMLGLGLVILMAAGAVKIASSTAMEESKAKITLELPDLTRRLQMAGSDTSTEQA